MCRSCNREEEFFAVAFLSVYKGHTRILQNVWKNIEKYTEGRKLKSPTIYHRKAFKSRSGNGHGNVTTMGLFTSWEKGLSSFFFFLSGCSGFF